MKNKKIIITADDYGMCDSVNKAIEECVNIGTITSYNVIFNMEETVVKPDLKNEPSVGIHWCITAGKPVSAPETIPSLVKPNGEFYSLKEFKNRFKRGAVKESEIILELKNQYNKFKSIFGEPAYWNTHQNSSILGLKIFGIFSRTAMELGIPATRNFQRVYMDKDKMSLKARTFEIAKRLFADVFFGRIIKRKFAMPSARLFTVEVTSKLNVDRLINVIKKSRYDLIEIVVHPAVSLECEYFGTIREPRLKEYEFFRDSSLIEKFRQNNIDLVGFECAEKTGDL